VKNRIPESNPGKAAKNPRVTEVLTDGWGCPSPGRTGRPAVQAARSKGSFLNGLIRKVFPKLVKSLHNRKIIKDRLERIRQLRNRVFHHERIIHREDLASQHGTIIETLGGISPELSEMALKLDRFADTHKAGIDGLFLRAQVI